MAFPVPGKPALQQVHLVPGSQGLIVQKLEDDRFKFPGREMTFLAKLEVPPELR
jgi:hypothetical protein